MIEPWQVQYLFFLLLHLQKGLQKLGCILKGGKNYYFLIVTSINHTLGVQSQTVAGRIVAIAPSILCRTTQTMNLPRKYMGDMTLIQISGLKIHRGSRLIISDLNFELNEGEVVALVGPNGCGKTTLLESSAGMHTISSGSIHWKHDSYGMKLVRDSEGRRNSLPPMGLTLQKNGISGEETVQERIKTVLQVSGCEFDNIKISELLDCWGLKHRSSDRVSQLSGGLARRLSVLSGLAPALLSQEPRAVLLDEPSEGLDESAKSLLINWLRALILRGHGIVIATHDSDLISVADRTLTFSDDRKIIFSAQSQPESNFVIPKFTNNISVKKTSSLFNWAYRMEKRNPVDTINRLIPAILALFLSHTLVSEEDISALGVDFLSALILLPPFISVVIPPALISRYAEENCGRWWSAIIGPKFRLSSSIIGSSILLPIPLIYISWFILSDNISIANDSVVYWLWLPCLVMYLVAIAASSLHLLVSDLRRSGASVVSLLLLVLVWPFIELVDSLEMIIINGMSMGISLEEPIFMMFLAGLISFLVWMVSVYLPEA